MLKIRFQTIVLALIAVAVAVAGGILNPKNTEKASAASFYTFQDNSTGGDCTTFGTWNNITNTCTLTQNISMTALGSNYGIEITSDNYTVDCNGHSITGESSAWPFSSAFHFNARSFVTIKNCTISNFVNQIFVEFGSSNVILNNTLSGGDHGVWIAGAASTDVVNNTVQNAAQRGIDSTGTVAGGRFFGNIVTNCNTGMGAQHGGDEIVGNTFSNNTTYGIYSYSDQTDTVKIKGNTIQGNTSYGIYLNAIGNSNTLDSNIVTGNGTDILKTGVGTITGTNNTCSTVSGWNDTGYTGCRWTSLPAQPTCGASLTQNTKLSGNLTGCTSHGLLFGTDNITLDCAGYMLTAPATGWRGINADSNSDVVIKNCTISGFTWGTYMADSSYTINVDATNGTGSAWSEFYATGGGTGGPSIIGSTAATQGIRVDNSVNSRILYNTSSGTGTGISIAGTSTTGAVIRGNTSTSTNSGLSLNNLSNSTISDNRISGGPYYGINLASGTSNTFSRNIVLNSLYGLSFSSGVTGNTVGGSTTTGNVILNSTYTDISDAVLGNNSGQYNTCDVVSLWRDTGLGANGCTYTGCGDGFINGADVCDDGNNSNSDGCSSTCAIESGWGCIGEPSSCQLGSGPTTSLTVNNSAPSFSVQPSDGGSDVSAPTNVGSQVTFTATATDPNFNQYYLAICKGTSITPGDNTVPTCGGLGAWIISAATNSGSQASVGYTTLSDDPSSSDWYAFVCDKVSGGGSCSAYSQGSGVTGSPFGVNHAPTYSGYSATDATGSTIEPGDNVKFTVTTADTDSDTVGVWICAGGDTFNGSACSSYRFCSTSYSSPGVVSCTSLSPLAVPKAHGSYNVEVFVMDSHSFVGNLSSTQSYLVADVPPYIQDSSAYCSGACSAIALSAGSSTVKTYSAIVKDDNGDTDLVNTTAGYLYDDTAIDLSGGACTGSEASCYSDSVCTLSNNTSGTDNQATATCDFTLWFNANYSSGWKLHVNPADGQGAVTNQVDSNVIASNSIQGIDVVNPNIAYGSIYVGQTSVAVQTTFKNMGNQLIDILASGDVTGSSMCVDYPTCTSDATHMPLVQNRQRFSQTSDVFNWSSATPLVDTPNVGCTPGVNCEQAQGCLNRNLPVRVVHDNDPTPQSIWWKLSVPENQLSGSYSGSTSVSATSFGTCTGTPF